MISYLFFFVLAFVLFCFCRSAYAVLLTSIYCRSCPWHLCIASLFLFSFPYDYSIESVGCFVPICLFF